MNRIKITLNLISIAVLQNTKGSYNISKCPATASTSCCIQSPHSHSRYLRVSFLLPHCRYHHLCCCCSHRKPVGRRWSWILRQHQHHSPRSRLRCQIPPRWTHRHHCYWRVYVRCDVLLHHHLLTLLPLPTMQQQNQCIHCK